MHIIKNFLALVVLLGLSCPVFAATAGEIDNSVTETLKVFYAKVANANDLVERAEGVLVFPAVYKAGFVFGGEYGEGALIVDDVTVDYYSTAAASFGWQLGAQKKSIILLFMQKDALEKFRNSSNWKAGIDASVAFIDVGANGSIDTAKLNKPIIAFAISQKGLMANLSLEGAKFTKLKK